jgi:RNA-directed DNA polymerase
VLNELDWWISSQWETFKTKHDYHNHKYRALKISNLKEIFIVRYADDFKLMCRDYETAQKAFIATKNWLKERLDLEISPEKSKVINLKKKSSDFLGFKLKIIKKAKKRVINSNINDKATKKIIKKILGVIRDIKKSPTCANVNKYNATILGMHNYYKYATHVNVDFSKIAFLVSKNLHNSTKGVRSKKGDKSKAYKVYYGKYNFKTIYIAKIALFPIQGIRTKIIRGFSQYTCNFTKKGRELIHKSLESINQNILRYLMKNPIQGETTEYNDNRISLYVGQQGNCGITGKPLEINSMESHHKIPRELGGTDEYKNLTFISHDVHKLIHAETMETIQKYMTKLKEFINPKSFTKINKLRKLVGNCKLYIS